jgi:hypothetical protein
MKIKTRAWGLAIAATVAAALTYAVAHQQRAEAQQDKGQDQKK